METRYEHGIYKGTESNPYEILAKIDVNEESNIIIHPDTKIIADDAFRNSKLLEDIVLPNGLEHIGYGAFRGCSGLTSVVIPDSVTSIGYHSFFDCENLKNINYEGTISQWNSLIQDAWNTIARRDISVTCTDGTVVNYSEGLTFVSLGDGTCYVSKIGSCIDTDVVIPEVSPAGDAVTSIGAYAFAFRDNLTSVTIPDSVTTIDEHAFYDCNSLTSVVIPDSVTSVGDGAFYECTSLTSVTIPNGITEISYGTFAYCSSLRNIEIPDSVTSLGNFAFYSCTSLESIEIPNSVTSIGNGAFLHCNNLTSVVIPDSVTSIGSSAFQDCTNLTGVIIPDSVTKIGDYAFESCSNLTSVTIPDSVTSIGEGVFSECKRLEGITIDNSIKTMEMAASTEPVTLTNLVNESQAFVINDELVYVRPEITGKLVIDMDIDKIDPFAFKNSGVTVVEGADHLKDDVVRAGISYIKIDNEEKENEKTTETKLEFDAEI